MGITAAETAPEPTRANTSTEAAQGTTVQPGTICLAASWLNEPASPWIAIFTPTMYKYPVPSTKFLLRG